MYKKSKFIYQPILFIPILWGMVSFTKGRIRQENHSPVVKIISPKTNGTFDWESQVNYEIGVDDKEDGDTKYDEINAKEVLLEVRFIANKAKVQSLLAKGIQNDPPGFAVLRTSNCFNCHNFNSKALGPSFNDIAVKYTPTAGNIELMVKHIREGSSGIWGKETMPTHPELSAEETKNAAQWILKNGKDADMNYYIGTTGAFHTRPITAAKKGTYILTASYVDHGLKSSPGNHLKGQDVIVLNSK